MKPATIHQPGRTFYIIDSSSSTNEFHIKEVEAFDGKYPPYRLRTFHLALDKGKLKVEMTMVRVSQRYLDNAAQEDVGRKAFGLYCLLPLGTSINKLEVACYRKLKSKLNRQLKQGTAPTIYESALACQQRIEELEKRIDQRSGRVAKAPKGQPGIRISISGSRRQKLP